MHHLINHLIENNMDEIVSKSLLHCHIPGLHSIMLLDSPGKTIRMYVAVEGNKLEDNHLDKNGMPDNNLSLSFHPHHCNLTLHVIKGTLVNYQMKQVNAGHGHVFDRFFYKSKIASGEMKFDYLGLASLELEKATRIHTGEHLSMPANSIHNVAAPKDDLTAWLVYEGKEDPDYIPYCYSNIDLNKISSDGLYVKPTKEDILYLLNRVFLP